MKKKAIFIFIPFAVIVLVAGTILFVINFNKAKGGAKSLGSMTSQEIGSELKKIGEERLRGKMYAPLIATYKKMLEQMPDNIDLKKKLAFAYFGAAEYEKARPLLEEVSKSGLKDDEVFRELEFIGSLKQ
ncbi:MAG: hypothetical protein COV46_02380 [Deltaproteobacteria bacterium CG11_big_fil_rev_8_21_14_0_20_49_13]|nr:MAG: hypothetical protein COV46_02380 [Deltaproteobacteria bacterium CG11_big_fil_rev_8_21_14_0_20_49_13]